MGILDLLSLGAGTAWSSKHELCYSHCYDEVASFYGTHFPRNFTQKIYNSSRPCTNYIGNDSYVDLTSSNCMGYITNPAIGVIGFLTLVVSIALSALSCGAVCACRETSSVMARLQD